MAADYRPPFTPTSPILSLVAEIAEQVGRFATGAEAGGLRLRRINRIRTIHSTLAIEGNTLTPAQVTAIIDGKRVLAPPREVQEVRNALAAYARLPAWQPQDETHLLAAHGCLMRTRRATIARAGSACWPVMSSSTWPRQQVGWADSCRHSSAGLPAPTIIR